MSNFVIHEENRQSSSRREYARFWGQMYPYLAQAVVLTFAEANMRNVTFAEMKDRTEKAKKIVDELRQDFKWSSQRISDNLLPILRNRLLGVKSDLDKLNRRSSW